MNDGKKKKPQKHQNKQAFKIVFDSLATEHQKKVSQSLLCKRCSDQISWKLQFNKYKKITQPSKCNFCHNKVVVRSYMRACDACAQKQEVCPKCLSKDAEILEGDQVKLSAKQKAQKERQEEKAMNDYMDILRQRSKRKIKRQYQKGIVKWDQEHKFFIDAQGNQVVGLRFKTKGLGDLEKQMSEDFNDQQLSNEQDEDNQDSDKDEIPLQIKQKQKAGSINDKKQEKAVESKEKTQKQKDSEKINENTEKNKESIEKDEDQEKNGSGSQRQSQDGSCCQEDDLIDDEECNGLQEA